MNSYRDKNQFLGTNLPVAVECLVVSFKQVNIFGCGMVMKSCDIADQTVFEKKENFPDSNRLK